MNAGMKAAATYHVAAVRRSRSFIVLRKAPRWIIIYAILSVHALLTLFPLFWVVVNSFRTSDDILTSFRWIPEHFDVANYLQVLQSTSIPRAFYNSVTITLASLSLMLIVSLPLAFALSRFRFAAAKYIYGFFALAILVPTVSMLPMTFRLFNSLGLLGTKYGIAFVYATEQLPISVFLLVTFMRAIPAELDEAALIDGCGPWGVFLRIILPLSRNGIVTVVILAFVAVWNDYLTALVLLPNPADRTLSLALAFAKGEYFVDYGMMSAAIVFAVAPMIVVYLFLKDRISSGLAVGAVKG
jgi:raffinose/stachyose/melibiose transport system permease protein